MVTFVPGFLTADGKATLADVANHMDHVRKVAGADHVGIGSDFDGIQTFPPALRTCRSIRRSPRSCCGAAGRKKTSGKRSA